LQTLIFTARRKPSFASTINAMANPSVCHTLILCQNERMQRDAVFISSWLISLSQWIATCLPLEILVCTYYSYYCSYD